MPSPPASKVQWSTLSVGDGSAKAWTKMLNQGIMNTLKVHVRLYRSSTREKGLKTIHHQPVLSNDALTGKGPPPANRDECICQTDWQLFCDHHLTHHEEKAVLTRSGNEAWVGNSLFVTTPSLYSTDDQFSAQNEEGPSQSAGDLFTQGHYWLNVLTS